jgi:hypothetical protein
VELDRKDATQCERAASSPCRLDVDAKRCEHLLSSFGQGERTITNDKRAACDERVSDRDPDPAGEVPPRVSAGDPLAVYSTDDDDRGSSGSQMTGKKRYGDPRKNPAPESPKQARGRSKRELSVGFLLVAWVVFFVVWLAAGSLLVAAIVFGALLAVGTAVLNAR